MHKLKLYKKGMDRVRQFCKENDIVSPILHRQDKESWPFSVCAYYRPQYIVVCLSRCASPATEAAGRNWNWPGSTTDREPYGVLCHELGHHCDWLKGGRKGPYFSDYSTNVLQESGEKPLTSYCPNDAEWFAEMMRLFITNAFLLHLLRPKTFDILMRDWRPVSSGDWQLELGRNVPKRILNNLIKKAG